MSVYQKRLAIAAAAIVTAACASKPPASTPAPAVAANTRDSVESVCVRGDTTTLLVRSRANGKRQVKRWLFTSNGAAVDLTTGRQVMDSAQVARSGIRELFREEAALDQREADLARRSGLTVPTEAACR